MKQVILAVVGVIVGCAEINWNGVETYQEMTNRSLGNATKGDFKVVPATKLSINGVSSLKNNVDKRQIKQNIVNQEPFVLTTTILPIS